MTYTRLLARQKIDLTGSLRSGALLQLVDRPAADFFATAGTRRAARFSARIDTLFAEHPERARGFARHVAGRSKLRGFETWCIAFQKTAAYHVLVVAGLHVGALVVFLLLDWPQFAIAMASSQLRSR